MSPQDEEASTRFLQAIWDSYQADVTAARDLPSQALQRYADDIVPLLTEAGGDTAKLALGYGLVDELLTRDAMRARIRESIGATESGTPHDDDYPAIGFEEYVASVRATEGRGRHPSKVAVIVASGPILDGAQPPGSIGGESLSESPHPCSENSNRAAARSRRMSSFESSKSFRNRIGRSSCRWAASLHRVVIGSPWLPTRSGRIPRL